MITLHRYVAKVCRDAGIPRDLAQDFCQDTFLRVLRRCRAEGSSILDCSITFLKQVAYNCVIDWLRRTKKEISSSNLAFEMAQEPSQDGIEQADELFHYFRKLSPIEKDMLERVFIENMTPPEAGQRLGLKKWAAYKLFERALVHLRDYLKSEK